MYRATLFHESQSGLQTGERFLETTELETRNVIDRAWKKES